LILLVFPLFWCFGLFMIGRVSSGLFICREKEVEYNKELHKVRTWTFKKLHPNTDIISKY
jgi:hypothetical protein